ncbi:hypothetical protein LTR15_004916 [Elasticomyces elasticus]|nr:hypothetical protein LTR15_004916 [Elasticomyces elasticus]
MPNFTNLIKWRAALAKPSFLSLPAEIRNNVYEHLFANIGDRVTLALNPPTRGLISKVKLLTHRGTITQKNKNKNLALLSTNRQIRSEAYGYVYHGQVPMEFRISDNMFWLVWNIHSRQLMLKLMNGLAKHSNNLDNVKHLKLVGENALLALTHDPAVGFEICHYIDEVYKAPPGEDVSKALVAARERLSGVECIEISAPIFGGPFAHSSDSWLIAVTRCRCDDPSCDHQSRVAAVFPRLKEIRMQTVRSKWTQLGVPLAGTRFFKRPNGMWRFWHTSEEKMQEQDDMRAAA